MSHPDERAKRRVTKLVKGNILSFVLTVISEKNTNRYNLELLTLIESKITDIVNWFNIKEDEYRKLMSSLFVTEHFTTEISEALVYHFPLSPQDIIIPSINLTNKLKLKPKISVISKTKSFVGRHATSSTTKYLLKMTNKQVSSFKTNVAISTESSRRIYLKDLKTNSQMIF